MRTHTRNISLCLQPTHTHTQYSFSKNHQVISTEYTNIIIVLIPIFISSKTVSECVRVRVRIFDFKSHPFNQLPTFSQLLILKRNNTHQELCMWIISIAALRTHIYVRCASVWSKIMPFAHETYIHLSHVLLSLFSAIYHFGVPRQLQFLIKTKKNETKLKISINCSSILSHSIVMHLMDYWAEERKKEKCIAIYTKLIPFQNIKEFVFEIRSGGC